MDRQEIERDLKKEIGASFITRSEFKRWYGCGNDKAAELLKDLDCIPGRGRTGNKYLIRDVAKMVSQL